MELGVLFQRGRPERVMYRNLPKLNFKTGSIPIPNPVGEQEIKFFTVSN